MYSSTGYSWSSCFVLISIIFAASCQLIRDDDYPSDWEDPSDMMNFRYPTRETSKKSFGSGARDTKVVLDEPQVEKPQERYESVEDNDATNAARSESTSASLEVGEDDDGNLSLICKNPMLKRFVSVLNGRLQSVGKIVDAQSYQMPLQITSHMRSVLEEYGQNCEQNVNEILGILENMFGDVRVEYQAPIKRKFEDVTGLHFPDFLKLVFAAFVTVSILTLEVVGRVSWMAQLKRLFVLGILVSFVMTYYSEIKTAEAEFQAKSHKLSKECIEDLEDISYFSLLKMIYSDWFSTVSATDKCKEYHEAFLIHPKFKVTPTKVIAVTFTRFALEPMEHMGVAFSKAFKNMFAGLPITLWIPAFIFVIVLILGCMLLVAVLFGYNFSINLPFWAGMQIAPPPPPQAILPNPENERLQAEVARLCDRIEEIQNRPQQQALPPPERRQHYEIPPYDPPGYESRSNSETLPYPVPGPDQYAAGDAFRNQHYQNSSGLRRRHTYSTENGGASEEPTLPYPDFGEEAPPMGRVPRSTSDPSRMRGGIGFEPLVRGLTEAQIDESRELPAKQYPERRDAIIRSRVNCENSDEPVTTSKFFAKKLNEMEEKVRSVINSELNNVSTFLKSESGEDLGVSGEGKDCVQVESVGGQSVNRPTDSEPSHSEPSLNQFAKEAEAGFSLDSIK